MDNLFAPWRIEWVEREEPAAEGEECVLCSLQTGENDRTHRIVARSEHGYVLLNNYPYNPGHAMVIPQSHVGMFSDLSDPALLDHARLKSRTIDALEEAFEPDGFNVGLNLGEASGGSIRDHLHTHVVPRWSGDTNFMPVIGDSKVIVEALEESYDRLYEAFTGLEGATELGSDRAVNVDLD